MYRRMCLLAVLAAAMFLTACGALLIWPPWSAPRPVPRATLPATPRPVVAPPAYAFYRMALDVPAPAVRVPPGRYLTAVVRWDGRNFAADPPTSAVARDRYGPYDIAGSFDLADDEAMLVAVEAGSMTASTNQRTIAYVLDLPERLADIADTPVRWAVFGPDMTLATAGTHAATDPVFCAGIARNKPCVYFDGERAQVVDMILMGGWGTDP